MQTHIKKCELEEIQPLRDLFLQEGNFQFIYNKCHNAGWADTYVFWQEDIKIGYGGVWGKDKREDRDAIFEFYLLPSFRKEAGLVFTAFQAAANASFVESQSNDVLLTSLLYEYGHNIFAERILFKDQLTTYLDIPGVYFRQRRPTGQYDEGGEYVLEKAGEVVATGGFVWNYNLPFIDMFYEVKESFRRQGLGSLMAQELKKAAYLQDRIPAARCDISNKASKATLLKAGMQVCGYILIGEIKK